MDTTNKVVEYKVIILYLHESWTNDLFQQKVNELLTDGWSLQGGVSVSYSKDDFTILAQALVKYAHN